MAFNNAGAFNVIYCNSGVEPDVLGDVQNPDFDQGDFSSDAAVPGAPGLNDRFGGTMASGDFNGDGVGDLAVGAWGDSVDGGAHQAGAVVVFYGDDGGGLTMGEAELWRQGASGLVGSPEPGDHFGSELAAGDFDGNGSDDLAVGMPDKSVSGQGAAGAVHVIYGTPSGLVAVGNEVFTQDTDVGEDVKGQAEDGDWFGSDLAAGDFDGDTREDLAVAAPYEDVAGTFNAGAVNVLYGATPGQGGLSTSRNELFSQDTAGIKGAPEEGGGGTTPYHGLFDYLFDRQDLFGSSLAAGDFDGNGRDDLAVGVIGEDLTAHSEDAGAVNVIYGNDAPEGLGPSGDQLWTQDSSGIRGSSEEDDLMGWSLASGDWGQDGQADLAIGIPLEDLNDGGIAEDPNEGAVAVLNGDDFAGLHDGYDQFWAQESKGIKGGSERFDHFGDALTGVEVGAPGLAIGTPREDVGDVSNAGSVSVLFTNPSLNRIRLDDLGDLLLTELPPEIFGEVGQGDHFGGALAGR